MIDERLCAGDYDPSASNRQTVTVAELCAALQMVGDRAQRDQAWNFDQLDCLKLAAKAEVCAELIRALRGEL